MSALATAPSPADVLFAMAPHRCCVASVVVPARNEEAALAATLDALRCQVDLEGRPLDPSTYELLLLLNNCTDGTATEAFRFQQRYPEFRLHFAEVLLSPDKAHVGTARKMLMDAACERMEGQSASAGVVLSTDADTLVAPDWIACNLRALGQGAEVVGGVIDLFPEDETQLEAGVRRAYEADRRYQSNVAQLESLLDPDPADPWPRHLQHFGASLACTCEVYRRSGGLPPVKPLEDVAFIDALRKVGARIRHSPEVHIHTSARLDGRAEVGLSGQLRHWQLDGLLGRPHLVDSAEWLVHRFRSLALLRRVNAGELALTDGQFREPWQTRVQEACDQRLATPRFLEVIDCNRLIEEHYLGGERHAPIEMVNARIEQAIAGLATE